MLRIATLADAAAIDALMKASTRAIFPAFYDERQTASAVMHIAHVDPMLLEDGTYFVLDAGEEVVACGGWSRRDKLFTGEAGHARRRRPRLRRDGSSDRRPDRLGVVPTHVVDRARALCSGWGV